jgi:DNA polymerase I-like protein with 3'-5' exonuclease and polymerase domains
MASDERLGFISFNSTYRAAGLSRVKENLRDLMCHVAELKAPLEVGLSESGNWDEAH